MRGIGDWIEGLKEHAREHPGAFASLCLHLTLLVFILGVLPSFFEHKTPPTPPSVTVEMVPIGATTNVKPKEEVHKTEEKKPEKPKPKPVKAATPDQPKPEPKKPEPKPEPKKEAPKPKPEVKKPEKKEKPKKEKPKDDFAAVLKSVEAMTQNQPEAKKQESNYDPTKALSMTQQDAIIGTIRRQVDWNIPAGARDMANIVVTLHFKLGRGGEVSDVQITDMARYNSDPVFQAAADSAVRAVKEASPLKDLPAQYYDVWKEIEMPFNPKDVM